MTPKRGERVAPPPGPDEYDLTFGTSEAAKGWIDLCAQAPANALEMWRTLRANPAPSPPTSRHHQLKGSLSTGAYRGAVLPQWQYEVTAGGRVWYLVDAAGKKVYLMYAGTRHPKVTE
ncbi:hypothetical protein [Actinoplanes sp. NPDC048796]|uniref:hypothetical protein n=1 Tax=unclassified Actinoplanes TaxID=2626549 RepID=UPI00340E29D1